MQWLFTFSAISFELFLLSEAEMGEKWIDASEYAFIYVKLAVSLGHLKKFHD